MIVADRITGIQEKTRVERNYPANQLIQAAHRVTERCNRLAGPCGIRCFSNHGEIQTEPSLDQIIMVQENLKQGGIKALNTFGGEPTLREDIVVILKHGKELGFHMTLTTNCDFMTRDLLDQIGPYIDFLSVSLDGESALKNDKYRGKGQFESVKRVIDWFDPAMNFRLKVNTQVHQHNLDEIDEIPNLFNRKPIIWKLLQYTPREAGQLCKDSFEITNDVFEAKGQKLQDLHRFALQEWLYIYMRGYRFDETPDVLIVRPQGDLLINWQEGYQVVGNALSDHVGEVINTVQSNHPAFSQANFNEYMDSYPVI